MVIEEPAIVSVLVRSAPVLTATVNTAVPLPVPLPIVKVMNDALLVAVQLQLVPALKVIGAEPVPPSGPNVVVGCITLNEHEGVVVVAVSFLLHADAISEAVRVRTSGREKRRSKSMPAPPTIVDGILKSSRSSSAISRPADGNDRQADGQRNDAFERQRPRRYE
jgi:hypothetical protein